MGLRRLVVGLLMVATLTCGLAVKAQAQVVPGAPDIPIPGVPAIDPSNPQIPPLPYVPIPEQLLVVTGLLSPVVPAFCQASYLGPLLSVVALTAVFKTLGVAPPVAPSFLNPLFGPLFTACVLAPNPTYFSCGPDAQITAAVGQVSDAVPSTGPAGPPPRPFDTIPGPFATVVAALYAVDAFIANVSGAPSPLGFGDTVSTQLVCSH